MDSCRGQRPQCLPTTALLLCRARRHAELLQLTGHVSTLTQELNPSVTARMVQVQGGPRACMAAGRLLSPQGRGKGGHVARPEIPAQQGEEPKEPQGSFSGLSHESLIPGDHLPIIAAAGQLTSLKDIADRLLSWRQCFRSILSLGSGHQTGSAACLSSSVCTHKPRMTQKPS